MFVLTARDSRFPNINVWVLSLYEIWLLWVGLSITAISVCGGFGFGLNIYFLTFVIQCDILICGSYSINIDGWKQLSITGKELAIDIYQRVESFYNRNEMMDR